MIFTYFWEINWKASRLIPFLKRHLFDFELTNQPNISFFMQARANFIKLNSQHGLNNNWAVAGRRKSIFIHFSKRKKTHSLGKMSFPTHWINLVYSKERYICSENAIRYQFACICIHFLIFSKFKYEQFVTIRAK